MKGGAPLCQGEGVRPACRGELPVAWGRRVVAKPICFAHFFTRPRSMYERYSIQK